MRRIAFAALSAALLAGPVAAAEPTLGTVLGTDAAAISAALAADGWEMVRYERETGRIEVYAVRDDVRVEAKLDAATGAVVETESRARGGRGPVDPAVDDAVRARLTADGYDIRKMERGRGRIEIDADRDGARWEIRADARTGEILKIEREDD